MSIFLFICICTHVYTCIDLSGTVLAWLILGRSTMATTGEGGDGQAGNQGPREIPSS